MLKLTVRPLTLESPMEGWLFPTEFPSVDPVRTLLGTFLRNLTLQLEEALSLERQVFVHTWKMRACDTGAQVNSNLTSWLPELGLGVWPSRPAPTVWTEERFMDASADRIEHREPDIPAYRLLHLAGERTVRRSAAESLFGAGAVTQMFHEGSFQDIIATGRSEFLPSITAAVYTHERFYVPLLDVESLRRSDIARALPAWLGRARVYLRESPEDGGVLLIASRSLQSEMETAARDVGSALRILAPVP